MALAVIPLVFPFFLKCEKVETDHIHDLTGAWEVRRGLRPGDHSPAAPDGFQPIAVPFNFSKDARFQDEHGWITLRKPLPAPLAERLARGESITFYSGLVSDVSRFYLNDRLFASLGRVEPYSSGLYRFVLAPLPALPSSPGGTDRAADPPTLFVALRSPGDRPLHLEGPELYAGPTDAVYFRFYRQELLLLGMVGVLAVVALYHFLLGVRLPEERHNLYFALFSLCVGAWLFFRSGYRDFLFGENVLLRVRVEYTVLFLIGPCIFLFLRDLFDRAVSRMAIVTFAIAAPLTAMTWLFSYPTMRLALRIWQIVAAVLIVYMVFTIVRSVLRRNPDAYRMAGGILAMLGLGVYDILASLLGFPQIALTRYSMPFLILSTTVLLTHRFVRMYRRVRELNENLESTVSRRTAELRAAMESAREASQAKSEFLANMSHEIRTPMTAVVGMAELLGESDLPEDERQYVATLRNASHNLLVLIDDILDVSRIEAGRLELEHVEFELEQTVADAAEIFLGVALHKGLVISTRVDPSLPRWFLGDPGRLRQILVNLIGNAVKFTERGEIAVRVLPAAPATVRDFPVPRPGGGLFVDLAVRDTGIGIPPEKWATIFEKFSQSDTSITRKFGGTGLGLSISGNLSRLMGGRIRVESIPGTGSTFTCTVWLDFAQRETPGPPPATKPTARLPVLPRILLVEDNADNRMLFQAMFKKTGFEIRTAENGAEGVAAFQAAPCDIIFIDIQMPVLDGLSATRQIRALEAGRQALDPAVRAVPIIALSAGAHESEKIQSLAAGCDDHIAKPFAKKDILAALEKFLGQDA